MAGIQQYAWANNAYVPGTLGAPFIDPVHGTTKLNPGYGDIGLSRYLSSRAYENDLTAQAAASNAAETAAMQAQLAANSARYSRAGTAKAGGSDIMALARTMIDESKSQYDKANLHNQQRYDTILHDLQAAKDQSLGIIDTLGGQESRDIRNSGSQRNMANNAALLRNGLRNSTVGTALAGRVREESENLMGRLNDRLQQARLGVVGNYANAKAGVMERRNDILPNIDQTLALLAQLGQYGYGN